MTQARSLSLGWEREVVGSGSAVLVVGCAVGQQSWKKNGLRFAYTRGRYLDIVENREKGMSSNDNDSKLMAIADLRLGMYSNGSGWLGMWALPVVTTTLAGMLQCWAIRLGGRGGVFTRRTF